jgi:hypothetical protein
MKEFRKINGTNYSVSSNGFVRNDLSFKILKDTKSWNGYRRVSLSLGKSGFKKGFQVHRLVAEYFIENQHNKPEVNHKDFDKTNNKMCNLEWFTKEENINHAIENNLMIKFVGENHGCAKLSESQVRLIKCSKEKTKLLSEIYSVSIRTIQRLRSGNSWKHLALGRN